MAFPAGNVAYTTPVAATSAAAVKKNSGFLRYYFGINDSPAASSGTALNALTGGASAKIVCCLGNDADTMVDHDGQLFGATVGHAAVTGATTAAYPNSLFNASNLVLRNMTDGSAVVLANVIGEGAGVRFPPANAGSGNATGQARTGANGRIPSGSKVMAWFQMVDLAQGASSTADEQPSVVVQTEIVQNSPFVGGVAQGGQQYITSIRVAVANVADASTVARGVLYIQIENSFADMPGNTVNSPSTSGGNDVGNQSLYPVHT